MYWKNVEDPEKRNSSIPFPTKFVNSGVRKYIIVV